MTPGAAKAARQGWLSANKWLVARRVAQACFLALFLTGPLAGVWIAKGTLASSLTLGVLPLTDPMIALQSLLAGHMLETSALVGAAIVLVAYWLVGGRTFCSWACPINPVADFAAWVRARLGIRETMALDRRLRLWLLAGVMVGSAVTGTIVWEFVNPVTMLHRGLVTGAIVGGGAAVVAAAAVLLFDLGLAAHGWCGHVCPVGAFYGQLGRGALVRVRADRRAACDNCMECFAVCPERQVIAPALRGADKGVGPVIVSGDCTNCGRCIDVCSKQGFRFGTRFNNRVPAATDDVLQGE